MKKYSVYSLKVIKADDIYLICRKNHLNDDYTEVLTNKKIKLTDKMAIEPLANYYPTLGLQKYGTDEVLMLSKEDILRKYLEINSDPNLENNKDIACEEPDDSQLSLFDNDQQFDVLAVPCNRPFIVRSDKVEEFLNTKPDPNIRVQIEENARIFSKQLKRGSKNN